MSLLLLPPPCAAGRGLGALKHGEPTRCGFASCPLQLRGLEIPSERVKMGKKEKENTYRMQDLRGRPSCPPKSQPALGEGEQRIAAAPAAPRLCPFLGSPNPRQRTQSLAHTSSDAVSQAPPCAKSSSEAPRRGREPRARRDPVGSAPRVPAPSRAPAPLPAPCERGTAGLFPSGQPLPGSDFLCIAVTPLPGEPRLSLGSILRLIKTAAGAGGRARMALGTRVRWMRGSSHAARAHSTKG